jgi:hypothetical protein
MTRTDSLFCWQELDPTNGQWRVISDLMPMTNTVSPLIAGTWRESVALEAIARRRHHDTGRRVRLARYGQAETLDELA